MTDTTEESNNNNNNGKHLTKHSLYTRQCDKPTTNPLPWDSSDVYNGNNDITSKTHTVAELQRA